MASEVENRGRQIQIIAYNVYPPERPLSAVNINQIITPQADSLKYSYIQTLVIAQFTAVALMHTHTHTLQMLPSV
jgi:hypothetical protein